MGTNGDKWGQMGTEWGQIGTNWDKLGQMGTKNSFSRVSHLLRTGAISAYGSTC